jgi:hypothetical protein
VADYTDLIIAFAKRFIEAGSKSLDAGSLEADAKSLDTNSLEADPNTTEAKSGAGRASSDGRYWALFAVRHGLVAAGIIALSYFGNHLLSVADKWVTIQGETSQAETKRQIVALQLELATVRDQLKGDLQQEAARQEAVRQKAARQEAVRQEVARHEAAKLRDENSSLKVVNKRLADEKQSLEAQLLMKSLPTNGVADAFGSETNGPKPPVVGKK